MCDRCGRREAALPGHRRWLLIRRPHGMYTMKDSPIHPVASLGHTKEQAAPNQALHRSLHRCKLLRVLNTS